MLALRRRRPVSVRPHFEGAPNRFASMRRLFNQTSTLRVIYAAPKLSKFVLFHDAQGRWIGANLWAKFKRVA